MGSNDRGTPPDLIAYIAENNNGSRKVGFKEVLHEFSRRLIFVAYGRKTRPELRDEDEHVVGVLRLRGARRTSQRVAWTEDVVDNEGMGKKKSKSE